MRQMFNMGINGVDRRLIFISCAILLSTAAFLYHVSVEFQQPIFQLTFIPANYQHCEQIVPNITMSLKHQLMKKEFDEKVQEAKIVSSAGGIEGFSGQVLGQYQIMHYLAGQRPIKTVCETGFNFGHSAFNYLTANDQSVVHSFDLGSHPYAHAMSKYLLKKFPTRFVIHFGDSRKTIPEFIRNNSGFLCDLIFVDGGHVYDVALEDLKNFAKIANLEENLILFDDYPTNWGMGFGKAWEDVKNLGIVREIMRCTFKKIIGLQRSFVLGKVTKRQLEPSSTTATSMKP